MRKTVIQIMQGLYTRKQVKYKSFYAIFSNAKNAKKELSALIMQDLYL